MMKEDMVLKLKYLLSIVMVDVTVNDRLKSISLS